MTRSSSESQQLIQQLILRPLEHRIREHKYRCAQSIVFGLPVIALQIFGRQLGGAESARAVAIIQMILSGWIVYVAATGLISEGAILLITKRQLTADFLVGIAALILEVLSIAAAVMLLIGRQSRLPIMFHIVVILMIAWGAIRWMLLSMRMQLLTAEKSATPESAPAEESAK